MAAQTKDISVKEVFDTFTPKQKEYLNLVIRNATQLVDYVRPSFLTLTSLQRQAANILIDQAILEYNGRTVLPLVEQTMLDRISMTPADLLANILTAWHETDGQTISIEMNTALKAAEGDFDGLEF